MPTYTVLIGENEYNVHVSDSRLLLDGEPVQLDLVSLNGNGLHMLRRGNRSLDLYFSPGPDDTYEVLAGDHRVVARVDSAHRRARRGARVNAGDVSAPMPGLVVEVAVREGDLVQEGQVLVVQEAMKMQMQLRAPFAGQVQRVAAAPGDQVEKGAVLVQVADSRL